LLAPYDPVTIDLVHRLDGPSSTHLAGTDELGRDTLSRLLWGARLSLAVSVTVVSLSLALGLVIGGLAGYHGGWIDTALTTFAMNTFLALPGILLAIAFAAFLGPGFTNLVLALAIGGWAGYARLASASTSTRRVPWEQGVSASSSATFCPISHNPFWFRLRSGWRASSLPKRRFHFWDWEFPHRLPAGVRCSMTRVLIFLILRI
jgi:hypothetical protein